MVCEPLLVLLASGPSNIRVGFSRNNLTWCKPAAAYLWIPVTPPSSRLPRLFKLQPDCFFLKSSCDRDTSLFDNLYKCWRKPLHNIASVYLSTSTLAICICGSSLLFLLKPKGSVVFSCLDLRTLANLHCFGFTP